MILDNCQQEFTKCSYLLITGGRIKAKNVILVGRESYVPEYRIDGG